MFRSSGQTKLHSHAFKSCLGSGHIIPGTRALMTGLTVQYSTFLKNRVLSKQELISIDQCLFKYIHWSYVQSRKQLYIHKCLSVCLFVHQSVCQEAKPLNSLKSISFIILHSSFIILHSSIIILHSSFLHFVTFKLFSMFFLS